MLGINSNVQQILYHFTTKFSIQDIEMAKLLLIIFAGAMFVQYVGK